VLKWTGALAAAAVVGGAAEYGLTYKPPPPPPPSFKPPLSADIQQRVDAIKQQLIAMHTGEDIKYTNCCQNGCWAATCTLKVHVKNGAMTAIEPDDTINANVTRDDAYLPFANIADAMIARRACPQGYGWRKEVYSPNRLQHPMKNVGVRGAPQWVRISWDEALSTVAAKMNEVRDKYGVYTMYEAMSCFCNSWPPALHNWYGINGTSTFFSAWGCHSGSGAEVPSASMYSLQRGYKGASVYRGPPDPEDVLLNSKLIIFEGVLMNSWFCTMWYTMKLARERGVKAICIEPRYTITSSIMADQWIPIRPGTDIVYLLAVANVIFKNNLQDNDFIAKYVEPTGLQKWKDYVLGHGPDGVDKTPAWAESICGIPADTITALANLWATTKPVALYNSWSNTRQMLGEMCTMAAAYIQAITGNMLKPGTNDSVNMTGTSAQHYPFRPMINWSRAPPTQNVHCLTNVIKEADAVVLRPKLDSGELTLAQFNGLIGNLADGPAPNAKIFFFENQHLHQTNQNKRIQMAKMLEMVVSFAWYPNAFAALYSDIILPNTVESFEGGSGKIFNIDDRFQVQFQTTNNLVSMRHQVIDPVCECRPRDWIWTQLGNKLGIGQQVNPQFASITDITQWNSKTNDLLQAAYVWWTQQAPIQSAFGTANLPSWDDFNKKPCIYIPVSKYTLDPLSSPPKGVDSLVGKPNYNFAQEVESGRSPFRFTKSGKMEFWSWFIGNGPDFQAKNNMSDGVVTIGLTTFMRCLGPNNMPPMAQWAPGWYDQMYGNQVDKYPLLMLSPHSWYRQHSVNWNNPAMREWYRHACHLSASDAKARGIKDGDLVHLYNDFGEMVIPAYVTAKVMPGTCYVYYTPWYEKSGMKTQLMPDGIDMAGMPNFVIHDIHLPKTNVTVQNCAGSVQVEKFGSVD